MMEDAQRATIIPWESILEDDARDDLVAYLKAASKPKVSKRKRTISISPCSGGTQRSPLATIEPRNISLFPDGTTMHYSIGGRAGRMSIPSNGLVLLKKFRQNLLSPPTDDKNAFTSKRYEHSLHGSNQYWTPAWVVGIAKTNLRQLK